MKKIISVMVFMVAFLCGVTPASAAQKTGLYPMLWNAKIGNYYYDARYGSYNDSVIYYSDDADEIEKNILLNLKDVDPEAKYFANVTYDKNQIYISTWKPKTRLGVYSYDLTTKSLKKIRVITGDKVKGFGNGFFANGNYYFQGAKAVTKAGKVKSYAIYSVNLTNGAVKLWKNNLRIPNWIPVQRAVNKKLVDSTTYVHFTDAKGRAYLYNFKTCKGISLKKTGKYVDMDGKKSMDNVSCFIEYKNLVFAVAWEGNSSSNKPIRSTIYKINLNKKTVKKMKSYKAYFGYTIDYVEGKYIHVVDSDLGEINSKSSKKIKY